MNPTERRRIVWGDGEHANLDPFVVDVFGRVYNGDADRPIKALDRKAAALRWNDWGLGLWHAVDPSNKNRKGPRRPNVKPEELVALNRSGQHVARWLYSPKTTERPEVVCPRPAEVLLAGDPERGWAAVTVHGRFVSVFHGPSIAAVVYPDNPST